MSQAAQSRLLEHLSSPQVVEVAIIGPRLAYRRDAALIDAPETFGGPTEVLDTLDRLMAQSGAGGVRRDEPIQEFTLLLPHDQLARVHLVQPPVARDLTVTIAKQVISSPTLDQLTIRGAMSGDCADFLARCVADRSNILVGGQGGAGKTTLVAALAATMPAEEKIAVVEEVPELRLASPHVAYLYARPVLDPIPRVGLDTVLAAFASFVPERQGDESVLDEFSAWIADHGLAPERPRQEAVALDRCVRETLRMRIDRLVLGEVRGKEARDWLIAANTGIGVVGTIHGSSGLDCLKKLVTLASETTTVDQATRLTAAAVGLVVHLRPPYHSRGQGVGEVIEVSGRIADGGALVTHPIFSLDDRGELVRRGQPQR